MLLPVFKTQYFAQRNKITMWESLILNGLLKSVFVVQCRRSFDYNSINIFDLDLYMS